MCVCLVAQSCPILCDPMDCSLPGSSVHVDSPGKNTGVGCHSLLQGLFPTQGSNPGLPLCRWILYHLSHQGSHIYIANNLKCKWLKCINQKTKTGCMKTCIYALSLTTSLSLTPPLHKCMHLFYTVRCPPQHFLTEHNTFSLWFAEFTNTQQGHWVLPT